MREIMEMEFNSQAKGLLFSFQRLKGWFSSCCSGISYVYSGITSYFTYADRCREQIQGPTPRGKTTLTQRLKTRGETGFFYDRVTGIITLPSPRIFITAGNLLGLTLCMYSMYAAMVEERSGELNQEIIEKLDALGSVYVLLNQVASGLLSISSSVAENWYELIQAAISASVSYSVGASFHRRWRQRELGENGKKMRECLASSNFLAVVDNFYHRMTHDRRGSFDPITFRLPFYVSVEEYFLALITTFNELQKKRYDLSKFSTDSNPLDSQKINILSANIDSVFSALDEAFQQTWGGPSTVKYISLFAGLFLLTKELWDVYWVQCTNKVRAVAESNIKMTVSAGGESRVELPEGLNGFSLDPVSGQLILKFSGGESVILGASQTSGTLVKRRGTRWFQDRVTGIMNLPSLHPLIISACFIGVYVFLNSIDEGKVGKKYMDLGQADIDFLGPLWPMFRSLSRAADSLRSATGLTVDFYDIIQGLILGVEGYSLLRSIICRKGHFNLGYNKNVKGMQPVGYCDKAKNFFYRWTHDETGDLVSLDWWLPARIILEQFVLSFANNFYELQSKYNKPRFFANNSGVLNRPGFSKFLANINSLQAIREAFRQTWGMDDSIGLPCFFGILGGYWILAEAWTGYHARSTNKKLAQIESEMRCHVPAGRSKRA